MMSLQQLVIFLRQMQCQQSLNLKKLTVGSCVDGAQHV